MRRRTTRRSHGKSTIGPRTPLGVLPQRQHLEATGPRLGDRHGRRLEDRRSGRRASHARNFFARRIRASSRVFSVFVQVSAGRTACRGALGGNRPGSPSVGWAMSNLVRSLLVIVVAGLVAACASGGGGASAQPSGTP